MIEKSILLVDPFKNLLNVYSMLLTHEGYLVETALETKEAFLKLSSKHYTILITELFSPIEETTHMIQWVKQNSPETYIIMVTDANIDDAMHKKLFEMGLDDLICKPFSAGKILVHIKKGLRQKEFMLQFFFNPAYFKKCLRQELKRAKRHLRLLSILTMQIPDREKIGDRHDYFFLELTRIVRKHIREEDGVGRENGGLGITLPETDQAGSEVVSKRLLNLIKTHSTFNSDEILRPVAQTLVFEPITYPEKLISPGFLKTVIDEIDGEYS